MAVNNITCRQASLKDIPAITDIFQAVLPNSLPAKLGNTFIEHYFLPTIIANPHRTPIYVALHKNNHSTNETVSAFAIFSIPQHAIGQLSRKLYFPILRRALLRSIKHPFLLPDLLISGIYNPSQTQVDRQQLKSANYLVYLGTTPQHQGEGLGGQLLQFAFNHDAQLQQSNCLVETNNERTIRFYLAHGFTVIGTRKRLFERMQLLLR